MAYIGKKPEDKFRGLASYDTFTGDGSTTTFDTTNVLPDGGTYDVEVFVDNVRQEGGSGKSYTIGNDDAGDLKRITFAVAPDNAAEIYVINPGRPTQINTVSDNAITAAKIQDDAVTSAKIADGTIVSSNIAPGTIANDRLANTGITINGTSIALGASGEIVAGTDWQAVTVADGSTTVNASAGQGYFLDTNAGVIEVFLPTSPTQGDTVILVDYAGTFATNNVIVNTGGVAIDSTVGSDFILATNNRIAEFVYVDSNKGWLYKGATTKGSTPSQAGQPVYDTDAEYISATGGTVTEDGDYKVHSFTGDGCFVVSSVGNPAGSTSVDYLVVAGGGAGGSAGAGGGAGGYRESSGVASGCYTVSPLGACVAALPVSASTYPVTVGGGGSTTPGDPTNRIGSNSSFSTITSAGGGGGGCAQACVPATPNTGGSGGSGGGGVAPFPPPGGLPGGSGNTPPVSPPQGNNGGGGYHQGCVYYAAGGGGGATAVGGTGGNGASPAPAGDGGVGATSCITGSPVGRSGGGNGYANLVPLKNPSPNNFGGGGAGSAGTANTGGGGGSASAGGKGIVIIRYKFQ